MHLPGIRPLWGEDGPLPPTPPCPQAGLSTPLQEGSPSSSLMPGTAGGLALELLLSTALFRRLLLGSSHRKLGRYLGGVLSILTSPPFPEAGSLTPPFRPRPSCHAPRRGRAGKGRVFSIPGRLLGGCPAGGGAAPGARAPTLLTAFCESRLLGLTW